jgi:hypothetical protein
MMMRGPFEVTSAQWVRADSLLENQGLLDVPGFEFSKIVSITHDDDHTIVFIVTPILSAIAEAPPIKICCKPSDLRLLAGSQSPPESEIDELIENIIDAHEHDKRSHYDEEDWT